jgi:hypothetical protein
MGSTMRKKSRPSEIQRSAFTTAWWTRSQRIRTEGEVPFEVLLFFQTEPPTYQKVADKAMHLSQLGMNSNQIAVLLDVDRKHVERALRWITGKPIY